MFELLDDISELVYVSDPDTYELLYINDTGKAAFHLDQVEGLKCYEALQGRSTPCGFCNNDCLKPGKVETWEHYNEVSGRYYLLKDRLIDWNGKNVRMEMAFDISKRITENLELKNALNAEQMLMHCVQELHQDTDLSAGIPRMLKQLVLELEAERAYVFQAEDGRLYNTYEACADGVTCEKEKLQGLSFHFIDRWLPYFAAGSCVVIENVDTLRRTSPDEYSLLSSQNIQSLVAVPLERGGVLAGFLGVDNPAAEKLQRITPLLNNLRYFLMAAMERVADAEKLTALSYHDTLTGLYNRTRYTTDIEALRGAPGSLGVIFLDLNGLKEINDSHGHADGDTALILCASELRRVFPLASLYRIGGDEFVVLRKGVNRREFEDMAAQLRQSFDRDTPYQMAMGVTWSDSPDDVDHMLMEADARMYEDKRRFYHGNVEPTCASQTWRDDRFCSEDPIVR